MSIHAINSPFIRPHYMPSSLDLLTRKKGRKHAPLVQPPLNFFFSSIIGTPTEVALARLMNSRRA